jgi:hypothetical protein
MQMPTRRIVSIFVTATLFVGCEGAPGSQVSPIEGEGELEIAAVTRAEREARERGAANTPRHAVEAWAVVVDEGGTGGKQETFGLVTASGALDGPFGVRFGFPEAAGLERSPLGDEESPSTVSTVVAGMACARWNRDACLSVGGMEREGISFRAKLVDVDLPIARVRVVDARRDPLEGIAIPFEGRLVGVTIARNDPAFSRPVLLVRASREGGMLAGYVEPPLDGRTIPVILSEGPDAIIEYVREAFERFELSAGALRSFERELRRELSGQTSSSRLPASEWQAYYVLSRTESGRMLPLHVEPATHGLRRLTLVRARVEDARVIDVIH